MRIDLQPLPDDRPQHAPARRARPAGIGQHRRRADPGRGRMAVVVEEACAVGHRDIGARRQNVGRRRQGPRRAEEGRRRMVPRAGRRRHVARTVAIGREHQILGAPLVIGIIGPARPFPRAAVQPERLPGAAPRRRAARWSAPGRSRPGAPRPARWSAARSDGSRHSRRRTALKLIIHQPSGCWAARMVSSSRRGDGCRSRAAAITTQALAIVCGIESNNSSGTPAFTTRRDRRNSAGRARGSPPARRR